MKKVFLKVFITFLALSTMPALTAMANPQWKAPDFVETESCIENGPAKVCIYNFNLEKPFLKIIYKGYLAVNSKVGAWLNVNGIEDFFSSTVNSKGEYELYINKYQNVYLCSQNKSLVEEYPVCPGNFPSDTTGKVVWNFDPPSTKDQRLMSDFDYHLKSFYVQIAFYDNNGKWDSDFGKNYHFNFHF